MGFVCYRGELAAILAAARTLVWYHRRHHPLASLRWVYAKALRRLAGEVIGKHA